MNTLSDVTAALAVRMSGAKAATPASLWALKKGM
jgi:hypothetical protein